MSNVVLRLKVIAAKAALLAVEEEKGRLYPGEMERGLQELTEELSKAQQEARTDR